MKCYFHSADLDGHCSGAIVKRKYPDCEMIPINYGAKLFRDRIEEGEEVWVVDFSFEPDDMRWLHDHAKLTWIDHHKTAIEENDFFHVDGLRRVGDAACELVWEYLYGVDSMPRSVYLLGRYDVWKHDADNRVLPFQYGMRAKEDTLPEAKIWERLFDYATKPELDEHLLLVPIIEAGSAILAYEKAQSEKACKSASFETEFMGLRAIAMNGVGNSKVFDSVYDPEKHDLMIFFSINPKGEWEEFMDDFGRIPSGSWRFSLYSDKDHVDCGKLARAAAKRWALDENKGGGHKGAAGFQCPLNRSAKKGWDLPPSCPIGKINPNFEEMYDEPAYLKAKMKAIKDITDAEDKAYAKAVYGEENEDEDEG
jgi:hypothetical protein